MKLHPIVVSFPKQQQFYQQIPIPFMEPSDVGDKALYQIMYAWVDPYIIKQYEDYSDRELQLIQNLCPHLSP